MIAHRHKKRRVSRYYALRSGLLQDSSVGEDMESRDRGQQRDCLFLSDTSLCQWSGVSCLF